MPQEYNVEGVGILEFPDEASKEEILKFVNDRFAKEKAAIGLNVMSQGLKLN